jgi:hypothetical protein
LSSPSPGTWRTTPAGSAANPAFSIELRRGGGHAARIEGGDVHVALWRVLIVDEDAVHPLAEEEVVDRIAPSGKRRVSGGGRSLLGGDECARVRSRQEPAGLRLAELGQVVVGHAGPACAGTARECELEPVAELQLAMGGNRGDAFRRAFAGAEAVPLRRDRAAVTARGGGLKHAPRARDLEQAQFGRQGCGREESGRVRLGGGDWRTPTAPSRAVARRWWRPCMALAAPTPRHAGAGEPARPGRPGVHEGRRVAPASS